MILPRYATKHTHCDFLTCAVPVESEKGVSGGCVKWGRLSACKEIVDGDLRGPRELQLLELRWVVLLLLHQLVQEGLMLFLQQKWERRGCSSHKAFISQFFLLQCYLKVNHIHTTKKTRAEYDGTDLIPAFAKQRQADLYEFPG